MEEYGGLPERFLSRHLRRCPRTRLERRTGLPVHIGNPWAQAAGCVAERTRASPVEIPRRCGPAPGRPHPRTRRAMNATAPISESGGGCPNRRPARRQGGATGGGKRGRAARSARSTRARRNSVARRVFVEVGTWASALRAIAHFPLGAGLRRLTLRR